MPFFQEATFHDRQFVNNENPESTSSTEFVDLPAAELTTKDLGVNGSYTLAFSMLISGSLNNTKASIRLLVDGVPLADEGTINVVLKVKDLDVGYTLHGIASSIPAGTVLKAQYKTDIGTITVTEFNIIMDGVSEARVI